jgi:hypothetical protein
MKAMIVSKIVDANWNPMWDPAMPLSQNTIMTRRKRNVKSLFGVAAKV